ncbi:hypothetical protein [Bacteroides caccae]|uniref:hypothetical protein n=1 Tax=Bacteroides caccae TaxID=47678 RepID=UPI0022AB3DA1|nr:hypothetical protein [Bacteroides caccae]MCZ2726248.1 hypothetical protein [Bacteroides caccae]
MSEIKYRYKFDSNVYVLDEESFLEIERMAKMNDEEIENLAENKFRNYLNDGMNPIKLEFRIRGVDEFIGHNVITELNYGERGYPMSVPEEVKYAIVDDITGYVADKFKYYKDDCQKVFDKIYRKHEERNKKKIRFWKYLFGITLFILLIECICKMI